MEPVHAPGPMEMDRRTLRNVSECAAWNRSSAHLGQHYEIWGGLSSKIIKIHQQITRLGYLSLPVPAVLDSSVAQMQ